MIEAEEEKAKEEESECKSEDGEVDADEAGEKETAANAPAKKEKKREPDKARRYAMSKIKEYLDGVAKSDPSFAAKYQGTEESLWQCWDYIVSQAKKSERECFQSQEMFAMAFEFFSDGLKAEGGGSCRGKVMAENDAESKELSDVIEASRMTDEEKKSAHERAVAEFEAAERSRIAREASKKKEGDGRDKALPKAEPKAKDTKASQPGKPGAEQLSLF